MFNATFNNISVTSISWPIPLTCHWQTFSSSTTCHEQGSNSQLKWWYNNVGTDCTGSCKSNYLWSRPWWLPKHDFSKLIYLQCKVNVISHFDQLTGYIQMNVLYMYTISIYRGRRGRDCMVVGFTTTYAIGARHQLCCEFESRSGVQHYVIKFVSDLRKVGGFLLVLRFTPPIKLTATI
jgi:hypothetical protein